jgi:hypothetical protein
MGDGTSIPRSVASMPDEPGFDLAAAIFPLPGGREVTASGWIPPSSRSSAAFDRPALPDSTAGRRRWFARRLSTREPVANASARSLDTPLTPMEAPGSRTSVFENPEPTSGARAPLSEP